MKGEARNLTLTRYMHGSARCVLGAVALTVGLAVLGVPAWAQTADDLAKQYKMETMEQALQTKERYDLYGLHFATDQSTIPADAKSLLDDIATTLKNFPDWHLRIVGHTDATSDPQPNEALSLARANAVKAGLVERRRGRAKAGRCRARAKSALSPATTQLRGVPSTAGSSLFDLPTPRRPSDCSRRCRIIWMHSKRYRSTTTRLSRS